MNDIATAQNIRLPEATQIPASGDWTASYYHPLRNLTSVVTTHAARHTLLFLALSASPLSFAADLVINRRKEDLIITASVNRLGTFRRRIAASEARMIALSILHRADQERRELAEQEARIGAVWEDQK